MKKIMIWALRLLSVAISIIAIIISSYSISVAVGNKNTIVPTAYIVDDNTASGEMNIIRTDNISKEGLEFRVYIKHKENPYAPMKTVHQLYVTDENGIAQLVEENETLTIFEDLKKLFGII